MSRFGRLGLQFHSSPRISAARKVKRFASLFLEQLEDRTLLTAGTADPFVHGLYQVLLQRTPLPEEVTGWVSAMNRGLMPAQVVDGFLTSAEFSDRMVRADYRNLLAREPEAGIADYWLSVLGNKADYPELTAEILASPEYFGNHGDDLQQWLVGLYHDVLGRQPAPSEQNGWVQGLQGGSTRLEVARDFVQSHEAHGAVVQDGYHLFLGREPETFGWTSWTAALDSGLTTRQLATDILSSPEFANLFQAGAFPSLLAKSQVPGRVGGHGVVSAFGTDPASDVATVQDLAGDPVTIAAPGSVLTNVTVQAAPPNATPAGTFPWGLFGFTVSNVTPGAAVAVTMTLPGQCDA
jgi:hypothetical protein